MNSLQFCYDWLQNAPHWYWGAAFGVIYASAFYIGQVRTRLKAAAAREEQEYQSSKPYQVLRIVKEFVEKGSGWQLTSCNGYIENIAYAVIVKGNYQYPSTVEFIRNGEDLLNMEGIREEDKKAVADACQIKFTELYQDKKLRAAAGLEIASRS